MAFGAHFKSPLVGRFTSPDPIKDVSNAPAVAPASLGKVKALFR